MRKAAAGCALILLGALACFGQASPGTPLDELVHNYLWPQSHEEFEGAQAALKADGSLVGVSRERFSDVEEAMRRGRPQFPVAPAMVDGALPLQEITVPVPNGPDVPVLVRLPAKYDPNVQWPLMFAMHGGPPGSVQQARAGAERMIKVWADAAEHAGWIVAAPALTPSISVDQRTEQRLPYEVFHPEQVRAVFDALREHYNINPDRIVSTGISLGSNYSIAFGTSHPDWFSAIVPVSTEGDSRELLLRNLRTLPVYILEGSKDKNIREITGPRAMRDILASFVYDFQYREFSDRAHEGFQEHYPDVLRWLDSRPRNDYPREVLRVPNSAITPESRRMYWVEADTDQALFHAQVTSPNRIDITARWAREMTVYLHDRLVNLDAPVEIWVNGVKEFSGKVARSIPLALEQARALGDEKRIYAAVVNVSVPQTPASLAIARSFSESLKPTHPVGTLSFWETYATRALQERFPALGLEGEIVSTPMRATYPDQAALRITKVDPSGPFQQLRPGDLLLQIGPDPFFQDNGGLPALHARLQRSLRDGDRDFDLQVWRNGKTVSVPARMKLGKYASTATVTPAALK